MEVGTYSTCVCLFSMIDEAEHCFMNLTEEKNIIIIVVQDSQIRFLVKEKKTKNKLHFVECIKTCICSDI